MANVEKHLKIPFQLKPFDKVSDTLDALYLPPIDYKCYVMQEAKEVLDEFGEETVSNTQFYVSGSINMDRKDLIVFEGHEYRIKAMEIVRNKKGNKVLRVVYV